MDNNTDKIGQSIFFTEKDANPAPPAPPEKKEELPSSFQKTEEKPGNKKPSRAGKNWLSMLVLLFFVSSLSGLYIIFSGGTGGGDVAVAEPAPSRRPAVRQKDGYATVRVRGVISESQSSSGFNTPASASAIARRIRRLADQDNVKAILLDINSPGGTVAAVQDIYNAVLYARETKNKKVVALFRDVAASGGYYIGVACDKIIAQPGSTTGSIGVIMQTVNVEGLIDKVGVKVTTIKSGKHKDIGSAVRPMTEEERTLFQDYADDAYDQFFDAVRTGRPNMNPIELKVYADGRIFTGRKAFSIGLIDGLGGEAEAVKALEELSGITNLEPLSTRPAGFREWFLTFDTSDFGMFNKNNLETLSTPKIAYLWTY